MHGKKVIGSMEKERNGLNNITNIILDFGTKDYSTLIKK